MVTYNEPDFIETKPAIGRPQVVRSGDMGIKPTDLDIYWHPSNKYERDGYKVVHFFLLAKLVFNVYSYIYIYIWPIIWL